MNLANVLLTHLGNIFDAVVAGILLIYTEELINRKSLLKKKYLLIKIK